jgi:hypothetical protein
VDLDLIEVLLHMSEGDTLDFKREQYPLAGATEAQKAELIKDVLAFANAWKNTDAHIIIGADENPGGRALVKGAMPHLDDASVQQLVNSKTNTPIVFDYVPATVDGLPVGILRIRKDQQRPIFLTKAYGGLEAKTVYVRRGSSTAQADPTEIARMGAAAVTVRTAPQVALQLGDLEHHRLQGTDVTITSTLLGEPPAEYFGGGGRLVFRDHYAPDPEKVVAHRRKLGLLVQLGLCVKNIGQVLVEDVRVVVDVEKIDGLYILDELPQRPRGKLDLGLAYTGVLPRTKTTVVSDRGGRWEMVARLGKVQPGEDGWSRPFWLGSPDPVTLNLVAKVFADNIPVPIDVPLRVTIQTKDGGQLGPEEEGEDDELG